MSGTGDSEHGAQGCDLVQLVSSSLTADTLAQRPEQGRRGADTGRDQVFNDWCLQPRLSSVC